MQGDLFVGRTAATTEAHGRDAALEHLERRRKAWLELIREHLHRLYRRRAEAVMRSGHWIDAEGEVHDVAWVCADDARQYFEDGILPTPPPAALVNRNFLGQTFRDGRWSRVPGRTCRSRTRGSHRNELPCWRPRG